jgi:hypothetical protein
MAVSDCLQASLVLGDTKRQRAAKPKSRMQVYQFRITLLGIKPKIWCRIQVERCSLDDLHWYIQGAFGWTNSHLHDFDVGPDRQQRVESNANSEIWYEVYGPGQLYEALRQGNP